MKKILLILLIIPLFTFGQVDIKMQNKNVIDSINGNRIFRAGEDFQISLPNNWIEIPKLFIDVAVNTVNNASENNESVDYAYQLTPHERWFQNPYIVIMVKRNGKIPENQLKKLKRLNTEDMEETFKGLISDLTQGETIYDQSIQTQWSSISSYVEGVGYLRSFTAIKLTEYGYIQFNGISNEKESVKYAKIYREIVQSITINEKDIYKSSLTDDEKKIFGLEPKEFGSALAFVVLIGMYLMYKRFNK